MTLAPEISAAIEQELAEQRVRERLLVLRAGDFAPSVRDQTMFHELCVRGRPLEEVAARFRLAPRTVKNIVARTRDRLARRELEWGPLSGAELEAEEERLDDLWCEAMEAWRRSQKPASRTRVVHSLRGTGLLYWGVG
jgi:hypothetical protein